MSELDIQSKTVMAVTDVLFSPKKQETPESIMTDAISTASRLARLCEKLAREYPFNKHDDDKQKSIASNIDEARGMANDAFNDLTWARRLINEPYEPHPHTCQCDSCRAAASDRAHDRYIDAELNRYP